jgi:hypothetical protein
LFWLFVIGSFPGKAVGVKVSGGKGAPAEVVEKVCTGLLFWLPFYSFVWMFCDK